MRKILTVAAVLVGALVPLQAQAGTPDNTVRPACTTQTTVRDRQACAVRGKHFLDCLSVDLARVACASKWATWRVTGIERDPARCLTGGTVPLHGEHVTLCLYPVWEG